MKINHEGRETVITRACTYCSVTERGRYRCPMCDPDGYLDDILQEDQKAAHRPAPAALIADMEKRLDQYEM